MNKKDLRKANLFKLLSYCKKNMYVKINRKTSYKSASSSFNTRNGTPPKTELADTSLYTKLFAPTTTLSPIVTPFRMVNSSAIQTGFTNSKPLSMFCHHFMEYNLCGFFIIIVPTKIITRFEVIFMGIPISDIVIEFGILNV